MNPPKDKILCLAYLQDQRPLKLTPGEWCNQSQDCARHRFIAKACYSGTYFVKHRVCEPGQFDQFLPVDRSPVDTSPIHPKAPDA